MTDETKQEDVTQEAPSTTVKVQRKKLDDMGFNDEQKAWHIAENKRIASKEKDTWQERKSSLRTNHEALVEGLRADITKRDELIQAQIDILKDDLEIDDEEWQADFGDRDVLFQYERLLAKATKSTKKDIPRTPKGEGSISQETPFRRKQTV